MSIFNIDLQMKIIKYIIIHRRFDLISMLEVDLFDDQILQEIFLFIKKYVKKYSEVPTFDILKSECGGIYESPSEYDKLKKDIVDKIKKMQKLEVDFVEVEQILVKFIQAQKLKITLLDISEDIQKGEINIDNYMSQLYSLKKIEEFENEKMIDYFENLDLDIEQKPKIPTPFKTLNKILKGGVSYGELAMILGETNIGKTMFLINLIKPALKIGKNVLYVTLEIQPEDLKLRIDSVLSNFSYDELFMKRNKFKRRIKEYQKAKLYILGYPSGIKNVLSLEEDLKNFELQGIHVDMLIVDYPDLFKPEAKDDWVSLGRIYSILRGIGISNNCVIWTASQIRRGDYGEDFGKQSTGRSIEKINIADHVFGIIVEREGRRFLKILKLRRPGNNIGRKIQLEFDFEKSLITEVIQSEDVLGTV